MIVRYMGGLGNQLFQYAFGRGIQERYGCSLRYDSFSYLYRRKRKCGIKKLNIRVKHDLNPVESLLYKVLSHIKFCLYRLFVLDREFFVYQIISEKDTGKYFAGIWQVAKYFDAVRSKLQQEFTVNRLSEDAEELRRRIQNEPESVAIHVRRGDYLSDGKYIIQDMDYFEKAIGMIGERLNEPKYYVFSDDIDWCRENFTACGYEVQFVEGYTDIEDFILMRACKNHIISNSTFSWWPAYLTDGGIQVAPARWFHYEEYNRRIREGLLDRFICL